MTDLAPPPFSCTAAVSEVNELTAVVTDNMKTVENYQKLAELQRDLVGFDSLLLPGRVSWRQGKATGASPWRLDDLME